MTETSNPRKTKEELELENAELKNQILRDQLAAQTRANAPVKKKKHFGCLWGSLLIAGTTLGTMCILGSCVKSCVAEAKHTNSNRIVYTDAKPATVTVKPESASKRLTETLARSESWRVDFGEKIASYDQKSQDGLNLSMDYISYVTQALTAAGARDVDGAKKAQEKMMSSREELKTQYPEIFKIVRGITNVMSAEYKADGTIRPEAEISKDLVSQFDKVYKRDAAMRAVMQQGQEK